MKSYEKSCKFYLDLSEKTCLYHKINVKKWKKRKRKNQ